MPTYWEMIHNLFHTKSVEVEPPKRRGRNKPKTNRGEGDTKKPAPFDNCQTPPYALDPLMKYIDLSKPIWEPATGEGFLVNGLKVRGATNIIQTGITTGQNYFEYEPEEEDYIQVTNCPFSLKYKWMKRAYLLGKPFAILVPVETLAAEKGQKMFHEFGLKLLLTESRVNFKMPDKGWGGAGAQFPVAWFTYGLPLESDIVYLGPMPTKYAWEKTPVCRVCEQAEDEPHLYFCPGSGEAAWEPQMITQAQE